MSTGTVSPAGDETVLDRMARLGPLPEADVVTIALQVVAELEKAYEAGSSRPGLTPEEIILAPDGPARLSEAAGALDARYYASPEQATPGGEADIRSGIYSLGACLYHMATGRRPFEGETVAKAVALHAGGGLPWPADMAAGASARLSRVIAKMMAKDPSERYKTPMELALDLDILQQGLEPVIAAHPPSRSTVAAAGSVRVEKVAGEEGSETVDASAETALTERPRSARGSSSPPRAADGHEAGPSAQASGPTPTKRAPKRHEEPGRRAEPGEARDSRTHPKRAGKDGAPAGHERRKRAEPAARARLRGRTNKSLAAVGVGTAVLAALAALLYLLGRKDTSPPTHDPEQLHGAQRVDPDYGVARAVQTANELRAKKALDAARQYAHETPDDFEEALAMFKRAMELSIRTSLEEGAAEATQAHRAQWHERAVETLAELERIAGELAAVGDFDAGSKVLSGMDPKLQSEVAGDMIHAAAKLTARGRERIDAILKEAGELARKGDKRRARAKLAELERVRFETGLAAAAERRAALLKQIADM